MKNLVKALLVASTAMTIAATVAFGATVTVNPNQLVKGAYVNGADGDQQWIQTVKIVFDAGGGTLWADGDDITITLPTDVTLAKVSAANTYADHIYRNYESVATGIDATGVTVTGNNQIVVDVTTVDGVGGIVSGDILYVTFPVETSETGSGSVNYTIDFPADRESADQATYAVTFEDTISLTDFSFTTFYTGNDDQSTKLGDVYPAAAQNLLSDLGNLVVDDEDGFANAVSTWGITLDATDNNFGVPGPAEPIFYIWASDSASLTRVDEQNGHQPLDDADLVYPDPLVPVLIEELDGTATTSVLFNGKRLAEGDWFFYLTSSVTGDWVLASSDTVDIRHWPYLDVTTAVNAAGGVDYNNNYIYEPAAADNVTDMYVETGGTIGIDGTLATAGQDTVTIFWAFEDLDDNATVQIFLSTVNGLDDIDSIRVDGTEPDETVTGLGPSYLEITPSPFYEESGVDYYTYDAFLSAADYTTAADYYVYLVTNDGKNQDVYKVVENTPADFTLHIQHYPFLRFQDLQAGGIAFNTSTDQYFPITWGETIDGDKDADGNATIKLYYSATALEAIIIAGSVLDAANVTLVEAAATLITTVTEDPDDPEDNMYMWDVRSAGLTDATPYYIIAHIQEGDDNLLVQYNSNEAPQEDATPILADRALTPTHDPYFTATTPVEGEVMEVSQGDYVQLKWNAFDRDAAGVGNVQAFIVPEGTTPVDYTATLALAATGHVIVPSTTGGSATGLVATAGPTANSGTYTLDVADITLLIDNAAGVPAGFYDVWYFYDYIGAGIVGASLPTVSDGPIRFTGAGGSTTDWILSPNQAVLSKGDTLTIAVMVTSPSANLVTMVSISIDVPADYFEVIDQGTDDPFIDEAANYDGTELLNEMTLNGSTWELNWVEQDAAPGATEDLTPGPVQVASFQVVVTSASTGTEFIDNLVNFVRTDSRDTQIIDDAGQTEITSVRTPAANLRMATPGSVAGQVDIEQQTDAGNTADFYVYSVGSLTPISDADFLTANGGANSDGSVTLTLGADGAYELAAIPTGDYDIVVAREGYLRQVSANVQVRPLKEITVNFLTSSQLFGGDAAGYDHDGDVSTYSQPDNQIDTDDTQAIAADFGNSPPTNSYADIDDDNLVYITDYNMATTNQGNGAGIWYKAIDPNVTNKQVVARLIGDPGDVTSGAEVTFTVAAENLSSLHAYAIEMSINSDHWKVLKFEDGMRNLSMNTMPFKIARGYNSTFVSAIVGPSMVREAAVDLTTITLQAKVAAPEAPALDGVTVVDGKGTPSLAMVSAGEALPEEFSLSRNYPNPFNPVTTINFALPDAGKVRLAVYNMLGQEVRSLISGTMDAGSYKVVWNSMDNTGRKVSSGVYFYRLMVDGKIVNTRKMLLLK